MGRGARESVDAVETPALLLDMGAFEANAGPICGLPAGAQRGLASPRQGTPLARDRASAAGRIWSDRRHSGQGLGGRGHGRERDRQHLAPPSSPRSVAGCGLQGSRSMRRSSPRSTIPVTSRWRAKSATAGDDPGRRRRGHRNPSLRRSTVRPALDLARLVTAAPGLRLGIIGYEGHLLRTWPIEEKDRAIREALAGLTGSRPISCEPTGFPWAS